MKILPLTEACSLLTDGATVATLGFGMIGQPEYLMVGLENRFLETGHPRDLTLVHSAGQSDLKGGGIDRLAREGLLRRVIGGHFRLAPGIGKLVREEKMEAYNFPQGVVALLYREIAAKRPGLMTHAGLGTFVDPRVEGGKMNSRTTEDLIEVVSLLDREWLFYRSFPIDLGLLRMTAVDPWGNLTASREACKLEALPLAMAAHNSGGLVIAQVERLAEVPFTPHEVAVPGIYVDYVVLSPPEYHQQTSDYNFNPLFVGDTKAEAPPIPVLPLGDRKVIARRAAMELFEGAIVNLGVGMPEGVASVAFEEGVFHRITLTVESGAIGGVPAGELSFGASAQPVALIPHQDQFDFYSGGGLDLTFLGLAEFDAQGNVNVSRFGDVVAGCGGFIEISQNAREVVFCGTLTASGLKVAVQDGKLTIVQEGKVSKAKQRVRQITFSGQEALRRKLPVKYVTERCVFELHPSGISLVEIAPGVSLERDILAQMDFRPLISSELKEMRADVFQPEPMGLSLRQRCN
ncbi:MAG: acyl CoA:acetate/3-ketoacid CoA transferase [Armatimonadetes bacterium]|nr:acyl CoA:acetate/3-ketoacid CoA transferase [Armatimonadota bacterium]